MLGKEFRDRRDEDRKSSHHKDRMTLDKLIMGGLYRIAAIKATETFMFLGTTDSVGYDMKGAPLIIFHRFLVHGRIISLNLSQIGILEQVA